VVSLPRRAKACTENNFYCRIFSVGIPTGGFFHSYTKGGEKDWKVIVVLTYMAINMLRVKQEKKFTDPFLLLFFDGSALYRLSLNFLTH
jgi:hypothetical protein